MKCLPSTLATGIVALCSSSLLQAQSTNAPVAVTAAAPSAPAPAPKPGPGLVNEWLRSQDPNFVAWDLGGQVRLRYESRDGGGIAGTPGSVDFRKNSPDSHNSYLLLREKLHLGYTSPWFGAYVEGRDSSSHNDNRNPNPESDSLDLHQGYFTLGNRKEFPLSLKAGRQELSYGDERLVGAFDWNNIGRVFDAVKLRYETKDLWVDGFVSRVVVPDDDNFNVSNEYDTFSGLYASTKTLLPFQETQLYFLARNTEVGSPTLQSGALIGLATPRDIYTVGTRWKSLPGELGPWDYSLETAYQFGRYKNSATAPSLDHQAFAGHVGGGYTFKSSMTPRFGLEYNYASGDSNPNDDKHETFENLFPTNHKFYGFMDYASWQNIHNPRLTASIKPTGKLTLSADFHAFFLAEENDFFYQVNGAPRRTGGYGIKPQADTFVGTELDFIATYTIKPYAVLQGGYGHFFVGDYIKESLAAVGGSTDSDWFYAQMTFTF